MTKRPITKQLIRSEIKSLFENHNTKEEVIIELINKFPSKYDDIKTLLITYPDKPQIKKYKIWNNILIALIGFTALLKILQMTAIIIFNHQFEYNLFAAYIVIIATIFINFWLIKNTLRMKSYVYTLLNILCVITLLRTVTEISPFLVIKYIQVGGLICTSFILIISTKLSFKIHPNYVFFSISKHENERWKKLIQKRT